MSWRLLEDGYLVVINKQGWKVTFSAEEVQRTLQELQDQMESKMPPLSEMIRRLESQFLDPYQLVLSQDAKLEVFRASLAYLNSQLSEGFTLEGLGGATATSLPEAYLPVLERGAAAMVLQMVLQNKFASYSNLPLDSEGLAAWLRYLIGERDALLDRLRIANLHSAVNPAWGSWKLEEGSVHE